jgi:hypothetical protein
MLIGMAAADSLFFGEIDAVAALLREQQAEIKKLNGYLADAEKREAALEDDAARRFAELDAVNAAHDKLLTEHIAVMDERNQLRRDLEAARVELADRREHMRRGIKQGMTGGSNE